VLMSCVGYVLSTNMLVCCNPGVAEACVVLLHRLLSDVAYFFPSTLCSAAASTHPFASRHALFLSVLTAHGAELTSYLEAALQSLSAAPGAAALAGSGAENKIGAEAQDHKYASVLCCYVF
jgi:hypothetical protein